MTLAFNVDRFPHGTRARYNGARCRCFHCRRANARYESERQKREPNPLVPADAARAHLFALSAVGVGYKSAADAASVARSVVAKIRSGERTQVRRTTADAILAVDAQAVADSAHVDAAETHALIAKLVAEGYPKARLAKLLGYKCPGLQIKGDKVLAKTALRIRRLHDALTAEGDDAPQAGSPRVQILRALERFDWITAEALFDALSVERDDRPRWTKAISRLAADGAIERRGSAFPFEYHRKPSASQAARGKGE